MVRLLVLLQLGSVQFDREARLELEDRTGHVQTGPWTCKCPSWSRAVRMVSTTPDSHKLIVLGKGAGGEVLL